MWRKKLENTIEKCASITKLIFNFFLRKKKVLKFLGEKITYAYEACVLFLVFFSFSFVLFLAEVRHRMLELFSDSENDVI